MSSKERNRVGSRLGNLAGEGSTTSRTRGMIWMRMIPMRIWSFRVRGVEGVWTGEDRSDGYLTTRRRAGKKKKRKKDDTTRLA